MDSLRAQAQSGLSQIEQSILNLLKAFPDGLSNAEIARHLGIETGEPGQHRNMLSWSILSRLIHDNRIERHKVGKRLLLKLATGRDATTVMPGPDPGIHL